MNQAGSPFPKVQTRDREVYHEHHVHIPLYPCYSFSLFQLRTSVPLEKTKRSSKTYHG